MTTVPALRASSGAGAALIVGHVLGRAYLFALSTALALAAGDTVFAHRLDEYLQAARIDLQADRVTVDLDLTPGASLAESVVAAIDRDQDGVASPDELNAYVGAIVGQLELSLDGERLEPQLTSSSFPTGEALRLGEGTIRLQISAAHRPLTFGRHRVLFSNRHFARQGVYLANALVPANSRLSVDEQRRTVDQREVSIDYFLRLKPDTPPDSSLASVSASGLLLALLATVLVVRYRQGNGS
jgi:hypothetical protein